MIYYDFPPSPSPRRTRMFIAEKGLDIETRQVDLRAGEQFSPEFTALNPRATVPVLITDAGNALTENTAIAAYLEEKFPEPPLMGQTADEKALVLMWNTICETQGFMAAAEAYRNSVPRLKNRATTGTEDFEQIPALAERGRRRVELYYDTIEQQLSKSEHLASERFTFADITGFIICEFARVIEIPIPETHHATKAWYEKIKARPSASV